MSVLLGIDLGTTNSLCAVFRDGQPQLVPNSRGGFLTPSVVGVLEDGRVVVGDAAAELRLSHPQRVRARFKRWMGTDRNERIGEHRFNAQELSSLVLRSLKADAEAWLGTPVAEAVITVPAYFNELQRQATRVAGELAGFRVRRLLNEPTAAALTYGRLDPHASRRLVVIDLGGGTFDVTAMDVFEGTFEIAASAGDGHLGGEDFTDAIVRWALRGEGVPFEHLEAREPLRVERLRRLAETAKRELGTADAVRVPVPDASGAVAPDPAGELLTREKYQALTQSLRLRLLAPLQQALRDSRIDPRAVDQVVLAGGATRDPAVQALVAEFFGRPPLCSEDPDLVVAKGAAIQAALLQDDAAVSDVVLTDVSPFTLGVAISKRVAGAVRDGYFLPVIPRNTTIPVSREQIVETLQHGQTSITVRVYQGESRRVADNLLLGTLEARGIPPGPAGQEVAVRLSYDPSGLLEVEAIVVKTKRRFRTTMAHDLAALGEREIAGALARLQKVKFYPRDDEEHLRLLLYAERVAPRVAPHEREGFDRLVDAYEHVLHGSDRDSFVAIREELLARLSGLGFPFGDEVT